MTLRTNLSMKLHENRSFEHDAPEALQLPRGIASKVTQKTGGQSVINCLGLGNRVKSPKSKASSAFPMSK